MEVYIVFRSDSLPFGFITVTFLRRDAILRLHFHGSDACLLLLRKEAYLPSVLSRSMLDKR